MPTEPLKPNNSSFPHPTPATSAAAGGSAPSTPAGATVTPSPSSGTVAAPPSQGPSPVQAVTQWGKDSDHATPISITFLTGPYQGQVLKLGQWLGIGAPEPSHTVGAEWSEGGQDRIRGSLSFNKLSERTFIFQVQLYSEVGDVSHLVENLATMLEIGENENTPPMLAYRQGDLVASPCICYSFDPKYSLPWTGAGGYRVADCQISLKLEGGIASPNVLGAPLTSTPLADWRQSVTDRERQKVAAQQTIANVFAPCLGQEGSQQVQQMIEQGSIQNPAALQQLPPETFINLAVSGVITSDLLADSGIQEKLRQDLATVIARKENGIGAVDEQSPRQFANAILTGGVGGLTPTLQGQVAGATADYNVILQSVLAGLDEKSPVFNREANPSAHRRMLRVASCGLSLRQIGADSIVSQLDSPEDASTIKEINTFLSSASPADIVKRFGLETESQARALKNGAPYETKDDFVSRPTRQGDGSVGGYVAWGTFLKPPSEQPDNMPGTNG